MKRIYLDNAATTPMDNEVLEAMMPFLREEFGNPSSTHGFGRKTKAGIETARKQVATFLNASPSEIIFTSGGTEADNMAILSSVYDLGVKHIITSSIEHHAVIHTVEEICKKEGIKMSLVKITSNGHVDLNHLEELLKQESPALVTLMHANNEIGNLLPLKRVGELCEKYNAFFHSDTVQTMGHYPLDTKATHVHFLTCGAHKFHGPKGVGFLFKSEKIKIHPMIHGGSQERNLRGGTENLYGIVGLGKALEIAHREMKEHQNHIQEVKSYMIKRLEETIPGVKFNGDYLGESLYTVLNVSFPPHEQGEMLLFTLDMNGIAASGGSACSSGSNKGSHVLSALSIDPNRHNVRFSFSKYTTKEEIDYTIEKLVGILVGEKV
jgi:cysteine desulfurase